MRDYKVVITGKYEDRIGRCGIILIHDSETFFITAKNQTLAIEKAIENIMARCFLWDITIEEITNISVEQIKE